MPPREYCSIMGDPDDQAQLEASIAVSSESATLADTNLRDVNYSREEPPRRSTTVGDVSSNKEQHPLYSKIHIPIGNPGMYPGCPPATTDRKRKPIHFRPPTQNHVNRSLYLKQVIFGPHTENKSISTPRTKIKLISIPMRKSSQFRSPT